MKGTRKIVFLSLMLTYGLVLHYIENMLPVLSVLGGGAKLGLTNIITLTCLCLLGFRETFLILIARVLLTAAFYGGFSMLAYSLAGGILSLVAMYILIKLRLKSVSLIGISITGAFFFNLGQILVAAVILHSIKMLYYLSYLTFISIFTGIFVGLTAGFLIRHLRKIMRVMHIELFYQ